MMAKTLKKYLIVVFCILYIQDLESQTINIVPLGNSITQSNSTHLSYRYPLWTKLIDDNLDFDYVGNLTTHHEGTPVFPDYNGFTFDQNHEGHWGWRCDEILAQLPSWLNSYTPGIAMIHLGTNDLYQGTGDPANIATTIAELKSIITELRSDNPNIIILLATLISSTNPLLISKIPLLNADIPQIAIDMADPDSPVYIVDQFDGFDASNDTFDGTHPNETGEEKMAEKWRVAINTALNSSISFRVNLKVLLEGPYNGSSMNTSLQGVLPLSQPFNTSPWNYAGLESVITIPVNAVDWVLVEIRDTIDVGLAYPGSLLERQACFILNDGQLLSISESADLEFGATIKNEIFAVIHHRNHISVISASQLIESGDIYSYDFTDDAIKAYGGVDAQADLGNGLFGMIAGDLNADGIINGIDHSNNWILDSGAFGFIMSDANLDIEVNNQDKNDFWFKNYGKSTFVPQ